MAFQVSKSMQQYILS